MKKPTKISLLLSMLLVTNVSLALACYIATVSGSCGSHISPSKTNFCIGIGYSPVDQTFCDGDVGYSEGAMTECTDTEVTAERTMYVFEIGADGECGVLKRVVPAIRVRA
jgi:hypothetical protein